MDWVTATWAVLIPVCVLGVALPNHFVGIWQGRTGPSNVALDFRTIVTGALVSVGYYLGAKLGFALTFRPHPVSVLWPPNSILVVGLLLTPPRIWWFILLAVFPAHWAAQLQSHVPFPMILCWFVSNSCEALIGAGLTRYLLGGSIRFTSLRDAAVFCLCVVLAGPFLSSFLDAAFVRWNHWGQDSYWELVRIRFSSNVLATLIVVPLIVTWATDGVLALRTARLSRYLEACALFLALFLISCAVLYEFGSGADTALLFLPLPFLLWAAVRFGSLGGSTAMSIVGFLAIWSGSHGHGPFSGGTAEQNALSIQIFLIVLAIPLLFLAAVIEERATGETELRESESRFRIVADAAPVLIWMSGLDKLCTFFNKPWLEFTGRSLQDEMGDGWAEGVHPDDLQSCLRTYMEAFDAREPFIMQYRLRRYDGEYRWISDNGVARYDPLGNFAGYIGSCVDVTDRKQAEIEAKQRREELSHLSRVALIGEMSASIAHELNQPLAGIASNASAGQRFIDGGKIDPQEIRDLLADISADARRASGVIRKVRSMIRKEQSPPQRINLNDIVRSVAHMVGPDALLHSCEVKMSLDEELPAVEGDPVQMQQVIVNLLLNAFDAMRDIPVSRRKVEMTTEKNGDRTVRTSVRDFGTGISRETSERMFEQFFTTKTEGLGMGLAIVRSIVESHGGRIEAANVEGGGARFSFTLSTSREIPK